jgi:hypothetical protein
MNLAARWLSSFAVSGPSHVAAIGVETAFVSDPALVPDMIIHGGALFAHVKLIEPMGVNAAGAAGRLKLKQTGISTAVDAFCIQLAQGYVFPESYEMMTVFYHLCLSHVRQGSTISL